MKRWLRPNIIAAIVFILLFMYFSATGVPAESSVVVEAFMLTGTFILFISAFLFVDQLGVLNIAKYGIKKLIALIKKPSPGNELPDTYYEYCEIKQGLPRKELMPSVVVGGAYLLIGFIIYFL